MSEPIDPKSPKPTTRRELLEKGYCEKGVWGPEIHATATEPMPDFEESGYRDVVVIPTPTEGVEFKRRGLIIGALTMISVSFITFYIPFLNALLGGVFGGFFAKRWGRAFGAAAIASVAVPAIIAFLYGFDTPDLLYFMYGLGFWGWTALHVVGMFIGAASGVYSRPLADRRGLSRGVMEG
ncbi:hypothetical protein JRI60_05030 [Archangium violaceum]|uniref:hypothetical protein n=1 Tax=Archangium violaceum TaxID=83451 RepID=UPI00194EE09A|nr:hypothetical protein [Archangium violaceum]QRN98424.1 hypothetical protein JRI60_05030 [Archangium violaceum]